MFQSAGDASWAVAEGNTDEYPFLLRYRQLEDDFPRSAYPKRINVFWTMKLSDENGFPTVAESEMLDTFEDRLVAAVEQDETAWLVAVVTGRSEREFVFYLKQPHEFIQCLSKMPQETQRYPIEIHSEEDPDWDYFDGLAPGDL